MASSTLSGPGIAVYRDHVAARDARAKEVQALLQKQDAADLALFQALAVTEGFTLDMEDVVLNDEHLADFDIVLVERRLSPPVLDEGDAPFKMEEE